jgi:hypothetical protein
MSKLNGWQRIGLILSVAWVLCGAWKTRIDSLDLWTNSVAPIYRSCMDDADKSAKDRMDSINDWENKLPLTYDAAKIIADSQRYQKSVNEAQDNYNKARSLCESREKTNLDRGLDLAGKFWFEDFLFKILIPLPLAWGAVIGLTWLVRWVCKGFNKRLPLAQEAEK